MSRCISLQRRTLMMIVTLDICLPVPQGFSTKRNWRPPLCKGHHKVCLIIQKEEMMHSKMSRFAEKVGDELSLSRRGFFSYLTKTAAVAAGAVGTLLTLSPRAHAD